MGTVELQSVPYALHSKTAETVSNIEVSTEDITDISSNTAVTGNVLKWDGTKWIPGEDNNTQNTYTEGTGIDISGTTISATCDDAIWNANKLGGTKVTITTPRTGQALRWGWFSMGTS